MEFFCLVIRTKKNLFLMASNFVDVVRVLLIGVAVIVLLPVLLMVFFAPAMGRHMGWNSGWNIAWLLPWLVLFLVIGYVVYRLSIQLGEDDALKELRRAYARGDVTDEEFEKRRHRLESLDRQKDADEEV